MKDPNFRQELLNNPRAVLAREYHIHLPDQVAVRVLEDSPNTFTLVLPTREEAVLELTDAELLEATGAGAPSPSQAFPSQCYNTICRPF